jgi:hypothetical protein
MTPGQWLLLITSALSIYGVGQVWLVQLSSYRLWAYVGEHEFGAYHVVWWRSIWGVVLGPAVLVFIGTALMLRWHGPGIPQWCLWLGFGLQIGLVLGTAAWWGPLMADIQAPDGGLSPERYHLLMTTHWLRVAIITAHGLLLCWMLARSVQGA